MNEHNEARMAMAAAKKKNIKRPPFEKWYSYLLFIFAGYAVSDLVILNYRDLMLPKQAPPTKASQYISSQPTGKLSYDTLRARNMFASNGVIPPAITMSGAQTERKEEPPQPSQLPLNIIGTLVHSNPEKSIAAIELKTKNKIVSYSVNKDIEGLATVEKIERFRVYIRNRNNMRLEYIDLKTTGAKVSFGGVSATTDSGGKDVKQIGENQFAIKRSDLLKYTSDLSSILMQARSQPARRGGTGEIYGYRIVDFQQDSIYTQLGVKPMDVITCVNGNPVTNPQQAMELYQNLRSANKIQLCVERDGKNQNLNYTIQ